VNALGFYPGPLLSFSIPGHWQSTTNADVRTGMSYEQLIKTGNYNLLIIDAFLRKTDQYNKEKVFFEKLVQHPELYNYETLLSSAKRDGPIYIFRKRS
jgi:DNA replication protein DnaC